MFRSLFDYESEQEHRQRTPYKRRHCFGHQEINFSTVFTGQTVGTKEVQDDIWVVSFMDYDLGYFDLETQVLEPLDNPFGPRLPPMYPVQCVTYVSGPDRFSFAPRAGFEPATRRLTAGSPVIFSDVIW
jgi:hypothetical protein